MSVQFQHLRGVAAPSGAASTGLSNVRRKVAPPAGSGIAILEARLTGTYSALELNDISWTWFDLYDAGLLDVLDVVALTLKTSADSRLNWANGAVTPVLEGAPAWARASGFALSGNAMYVRSGVVPGAAGLKYSANSAHAAVSLSSASGLASGASVIGSLSASPAPLYVIPGASTNTMAQGRINATTGGISVAYTGARDGLWLLNRPGSASERLLRNGELIGSDTTAASAVPSGEVVFGRLNVSMYNFSMDAFSVGAGLTPTQETSLATIIADHNARVRRWT